MPKLVKNGIEYVAEPNKATFYAGQDSGAIQLGTVLAVARNQATLASWYGTNTSCWSVGTWTQYGVMANNVNPWRLKITAPNNEDWDILFELQTGTVHHSNSSQYAGAGIARLTGNNNTVGEVLSEDIIAFNIYKSLSGKATYRVPAGQTMYFCAWVATSGTANCSWHGAGYTAAGGLDSEANWSKWGSSCILKATLLNRIAVNGA